MNGVQHKLNLISEKIIEASYEVSNTLGAGFLENVYENSLFIELQAKGLFVEKQKRIEVNYKNNIVGDYYADLLVERSIIIEIKAIKTLIEIHQAQLLNYLKATNITLGLLINFGNPKVEIKRMIDSK
ncbi:hypothetical protein COTS27_00913 [Spirochaetota bacterium]|nr:hypothetical protein COTS27_00913 [Spirochaetota bacterium]